jgi:P27 family predicted phage terminase small subunit
MTPDTLLPDPPAGLSAEAQSRWRAVIADVVRAGRFDPDQLQTYCQVWARWREAETTIAKTGQLLKRPNGGVAPNPLIAISNQASSQVRALERQLGLSATPDAPRAGEPLSLRAYARRRGVSVEAVSRAVERGRLVESVVRVGGVPKIADPDLADDEWAANTDLSRAPADVKARGEVDNGGEAPADGEPTLATSSAREKHWKAQLAELQYKQRAGELVEAAAVTAAIAAEYLTVRTKLLGLPSKAKQQLPHLTLADLATLDAIVREALEALARGDGAA